MLKPDTPESRLLVDWVEGGECLIAAQLLAHLAVLLNTHLACLQSQLLLTDP